MTNKLKELEEQNRHLREQNAHCNDQMDLLKNRLEQLQEMSSSKKRSSQSGSRPNSSIMEVGLYQHFTLNKIMDNKIIILRFLMQFW